MILNSNLSVHGFPWVIIVYLLGYPSSCSSQHPVREFYLRHILPVLCCQQKPTPFLKYLRMCLLSGMRRPTAFLAMGGTVTAWVISRGMSGAMTCFCSNAMMFLDLGYD